MRDTSSSGRLRTAADEAGVHVEIVRLDVTDPASVDRAIASTMEACGHIDVLLNNAAVAKVAPIEFTDGDEVERLFDTNVFGPLRLIRAVLPRMREAGQGRIVNVSTLASHPRMGFRLWGVYPATKAALATLSLELCKEVAPLGIDVVLLDGGVSGRSSMTDAAGDAARAFQPESSPYGAIERVTQAQLVGMIERTGAPASETAKLIADACTMKDPPLRFPPEEQARGDASDRLDDDRFLRLASLDLSPELYEEPAFAWGANLASGAVSHRSP